MVVSPGTTMVPFPNREFSEKHVEVLPFSLHPSTRRRTFRKLYGACRYFVLRKMPAVKIPLLLHIGIAGRQAARAKAPKTTISAERKTLGSVPLRPSKRNQAAGYKLRLCERVAHKKLKRF